MTKLDQLDMTLTVSGGPSNYYSKNKQTKSIKCP